MSVYYPFGLPNNNNFAEYIYYEGFIMPHEVDRITNFWAEDKIEKATVTGDTKYKDELRKSSVMFIDKTSENDWLYRKLAELAIMTNNQRYHFDILGFQQELQLTRYSENDFFDWHLDFGPGGISTRKLSVTVQLSDTDDYEGGDLEFMINQNIVKAPRKKGTVIIFPSFILHRVTPITKGTRQSIVGWVAGPPYR